MTRYVSAKSTCAVCRKKVRHPLLSSTIQMGSPDLDLRPPELMRSTMKAWVNRCDRCGYASEDLSEALPGAADIVKSADYREILVDPDLPELAITFRCQAALLSKTDPRAAAHAHLHSAWACDDEGRDDLARGCRMRSAEGFRALKPFGDTPEGVVQAAIFVDVLRRAGLFREASAECAAAFTLESARDRVHDVLRYEERLIAREDVAAHSLEECDPERPGSGTLREGS